MTNKVVGYRNWLVASLIVAFMAVIVAATVVNRMEQQQKIADAQALINEGIAQFRADQYELSLQTLGRVPEDLVEDWHVPYYMGSAMIKLKKYELAAERLEQALVLNSREKNIFFALGVVYFKLGNLGLSKAYFAAVLEIDPGHDEAKGLMDTMAELERRLSGPDGDQGSGDDVAGEPSQ